MIKKVNKNKFGVIEYSITNADDLVNLPKGDTDNSVYAVDDNNKVYLYSKKANDYILINGGGTDSPNELTIKRIDMGDPGAEVDIDLFDGDGYYSVMGSINGYVLYDSIVHVLGASEQEIMITLYEHCKHLMATKDEGGMTVYIEEIQFEPMVFIGDLTELPSGLQGKTLVEIINILYNSSSPS